MSTAKFIKQYSINRRSVYDITYSNNPVKSGPPGNPIPLDTLGLLFLCPQVVKF